MNNLPHRAGRHEPKELIIEYLLEGNNRTDLVELLYDYLPEEARIKILDEIDNRDLEEDHRD